MNWDWSDSYRWLHLLITFSLWVWNFCLSKKWAHYSPKITSHNETNKPLCAVSCAFQEPPVHTQEAAQTPGYSDWDMEHSPMDDSVFGSCGSCPISAIKALAPIQGAPSTPSPWFWPCSLSTDSLQSCITWKDTGIPSPASSGYSAFDFVTCQWQWTTPDKHILCVLSIILIPSHLAARIVLSYFKASAVS